MVTTEISKAFVVEVHIARVNDETSNLESKQIARPEFTTASDAFDYHTQAIGYFRFAIQDSDIHHIDIEVIHNGECFEFTQITRD